MVTPHSLPGNTSKEMVDDDLFISKTYSHWIFGADNTGNIMKKENIADLKKRVMTQVGACISSLHCVPLPWPPFLFSLPFTLVSLRFSVEASRSTFCRSSDCVSATLPFTCATVTNGLITLVVTITKPGQSSFDIFLDESPLEACRKYQVFKLSFHFRSDIPAEFLQQFKECSKKFMSYQRNMIESNLETFGNLPQAKKKELFQVR